MKNNTVQVKKGNKIYLLLASVFSKVFVQKKYRILEVTKNNQTDFSAEKRVFFFFWKTIASSYLNEETARLCIYNDKNKTKKVEKKIHKKIIATL